MSLPIEEQWRPILGYEGIYSVSSEGRVWSTPRARTRGGIMRPRSGGRYLNVYLTRGGNRRNVSVHSLVAAAFLGPRPDGMEVRHLDGNALNNRASNLAYGTHRENVKDMVRHGTHNTGSKTICKRGHSLIDPANITIDKLGGRRCRACNRDRHRRRAAADLRATVAAALGEA